jgi:uncharacterized protein YodC (DUF2158 family)
VFESRKRHHFPSIPVVLSRAASGVLAIAGAKDCVVGEVSSAIVESQVWWETCSLSMGGQKMSNSFKTGDVVRLKSGGPKMTISDGAASGTYMCHWFNREGDMWTPQHAGFKPDQLVVADQSD